MALLTELADDTSEAVETLREVAHGIYPPLLAAEGLPAALLSRAWKAAITVDLQVADDLPRYDQDIEAAVYFCVLEALSNAAKHGAAAATVAAAREGEALSFSVADDGPGFDSSTAPSGHGLATVLNRAAALDGQLVIDSKPGEARSWATRYRLPAGPDRR